MFNKDSSNKVKDLNWVHPDGQTDKEAFRGMTGSSSAGSAPCGPQKIKK